MCSNHQYTSIASIGAALLIAIGAFQAHAHCDSLDGPVVADARVALEQNTIDPVLKWVRVQDEQELKKVFQHVAEVRNLNDQARQLADRYFFETLVRIHREGEGAPYTGLKPEGSPIDLGIALADNAVATGDVNELTQHVKHAVDRELRHRFESVREKVDDADASTEAGRAYVAAYVDFIHYAEALVQAAKGGHAHGAAASDVAADEHATHNGEPEASVGRDRAAGHTR